MAFSLVPETGSGLANANAFGSRAQITACLEASPFAAAWAGVDGTKQDQCIAEASAWLSRLDWDGIRTVETQALAFPRAWLETPDGYAVASNLIPTWLLDATARLAYWLSQQNGTPYEGNGLAQGTEIALPGGLRLTPERAGTLPRDIWQLVRPYVRRSASLVRA